MSEGVESSLFWGSVVGREFVFFPLGSHFDFWDGSMDLFFFFFFF